MPKMYMDRDWMVTTDRGHTIRFKKGESTFVPDDFYVLQECQKYGAKYLDDREAVVPETNKSPAIDPNQRQVLMVELFTKMKASPSEYRDGFTTLGKPGIRFVTKTLNFDVAKHELDLAWKTVLDAA